MPQTEQLIDTLKRSLKAHRKTYRDVALALDLSEASVKRLFSEKNLSLQRLDQICGLLEIEISDLVQSMNERSHSLTRLTQEQEKEIAGDLHLLLVTVCVLNRWTMSEIMQAFTLTEPECIRCLARLDRLKLIDLLPGNRVKLRVSSTSPGGRTVRFSDSSRSASKRTSSVAALPTTTNNCWWLTVCCRPIPTPCSSASSNACCEISTN